MEIYVLKRTYDSYGAHITITLIGGFLAIEMPDFGSAVTEIDILAYFRNTGASRPGFEDEYNKHHSYMDTLPKYRFMRKKRRFKIEYASKAASAEEISKAGVFSLEWFSTAYQEVKEHLTALKKKLKRTDDFDVDGFLNWVAAKEQDIPSDIEGLQALDKKTKAWREEKKEAMDDWEKLGLDWEDFHPEARNILDDPFYWDTANPFSPNGNDTGADIFYFFTVWRKRNAGKSSEKFFERLLENWNIEPDTTKQDETSSQAYDDGAIGLAFAHLKVDGACPDWIRSKALSSIQRQREIIEQQYRDWEHFDEKMQSLQLIENKLKECPVAG